MVSRLKSQIIQNNYWIYAGFLIVITLLSLEYEVYFPITFIKIVAYILFFIIAILGIYSFYKIQKSEQFLFSDLALILVYSTSFILLFFTKNIVLAMPVLALAPLLFSIKESFHIITQVLCALILIPFSFLIFVIIFLNLFGFTRRDIYKILPSPDKSKNLIFIYYDQGILGFSEELRVEKNYSNIISVSKSLVFDQTIEARWLDNNRIFVDCDWSCEENIKKISFLP